MDAGILTNLWIGFQVAVSPWNLFYCLVGVLLGTLIGVLPGIGPVATIAMLLPITFNLNPVAALIMLAGIYYGAQRSEERRVGKECSARGVAEDCKEKQYVT